METTSVRVENATHRREAAREAASVFEAGGLVAFPTETTYGIAALAISDAGYDALSRYRGGERPRPFAVHVPHASHVARYASVAGARVQRLIRRALPGPVTLILDVDPQEIPSRLDALGMAPDQASRLYHDNRVAVRCPSDPTGQAILAAADGPVIASGLLSAAGRPVVEPSIALDVAGGHAGLVVDGGRCRYSRPSTVVHVVGHGRNSRIDVVREGIVDTRMIRNMTQRLVLFVCTGNTCRSPMAEALARRILAEQEGVPIDDLSAVGVDVASAGVSAGAAMPAADEAVQVMKAQGLDLSAHQSRELSADLVNQAEQIFCMTRRHRDAVVAAFPDAADKTVTLDPAGDIADPIGRGMPVYEETARSLEKHLRAALAVEPEDDADTGTNA